MLDLGDQEWGEGHSVCPSLRNSIVSEEQSPVFVERKEPRHSFVSLQRAQQGRGPRLEGSRCRRAGSVLPLSSTKTARTCDAVTSTDLLSHSVLSKFPEWFWACFFSWKMAIRGLILLGLVCKQIMICLEKKKSWCFLERYFASGKSTILLVIRGLDQRWRFDVISLLCLLLETFWKRAHVEEEWSQSLKSKAIRKADLGTLYLPPISRMRWEIERAWWAFTHTSLKSIHYVSHMHWHQLFGMV